MKARRMRPDRGAERRRNLAEMNLLSEQRQRAKPTGTGARGCILPFLGALALAVLPLAIWLR